MRSIEACNGPKNDSIASECHLRLFLLREFVASSIQTVLASRSMVVGLPPEKLIRTACTKRVCQSRLFSPTLVLFLASLGRDTRQRSWIGALQERNVEGIRSPPVRRSLLAEGARLSLLSLPGLSRLLGMHGVAKEASCDSVSRRWPSAIETMQDAECIAYRIETLILRTMRATLCTG